MWFARDIEYQISELEKQIRAYREAKDAAMDWDEENELELTQLESELSAFRRVLDDHAKPRQEMRMTLDELLQPLKDAGFFCQLVDGPMNRMQSRILTIAKDGIAGHSYRFNVEEFLHDLMMLDGYVPIEHMRLELNIGLVPVKASLPEEATKQRSEMKNERRRSRKCVNEETGIEHPGTYL